LNNGDLIHKDERIFIFTTTRLALRPNAFQ